MPRLDVDVDTSIAAGMPMGAVRVPVPPRDPTGSADDYESGTVVLVLDVDPEGVISKVAMDRSSGYPKLDAAAIEAAASWRFTPAQEGGKPVRSRVRVPVTFVAE